MSHTVALFRNSVYILTLFFPPYDFNPRKVSSTPLSVGAVHCGGRELANRRTGQSSWHVLAVALPQSIITKVASKR